MSIAATSRITIAFCLLAALASCDDPAIERGVPPTLVLDKRSMTVPLYSFAAARQLQNDIDELANGDTGAVRAVVRTNDAQEAQAARARLIDDGIAPSAISVSRTPDNVAVVSRVTIRPVSCQEAINPGWLGDAANSIDSLGRCVQASNLAAMAADPDDLVAPTKQRPGDGAVAARAVLNWQRGATGPTRPGAPGNGNAEPSGGGGGGSGPTSGMIGDDASRASDAPAVNSQSAPPPASGNPLLAPSLRSPANVE